MKVVVVGAGYAGTLAANRLAKKVRGARVTVVNPRPEFVERVRLHQRVAGTSDAVAPLASMLSGGVELHVGAVDKIGEDSVALEGGGSLDFDYLFLAVGSTVRPLPGTVPVGTWEGAERAGAALAGLARGSAVTVIGGGATGIETAAEIAAARPDVRVRLVGSSVAADFSGAARRRVLAGLARLNVETVEESVVEVDPGEGEFGGVLRLASGAALSSDLTLWAIVSGVPDLAARSGLTVDAQGRAVVDDCLRSVDNDRIFVVGDCAAVPGTRFACQSAGPQGAVAVNNLARLLKGRAPEPYAMRYVARGVTLGREEAVAQFTHRDDTLRGGYLAGRTAARVKELGSRGAKYGARAGTGLGS
ncbi:NAD(P)/FAD-dependent oxidoreductase [Streptomyces sp. NPDC050504]|uniref:NAD(P)/FAD-dependent oxidoreductase n=1 Tax=Streptomyces sp. NPDC050504 TaxID=3365618 RepID=UPI003789E292